jgi:hypothetical protein
LSPFSTSPILLSFHRTKCEKLCSGTQGTGREAWGMSFSCYRECM